MQRLSGWLAVCAALACGADGEPAPAPDPDSTPIAFTAHGLPGPWWRPGASGQEFRAESRACRQRSAEARRRNGARDPMDAAYRAFLDCMGESGWTRGSPPENVPQRPNI